MRDDRAVDNVERSVVTMFLVLPEADHLLVAIDLPRLDDHAAQDDGVGAGSVGEALWSTRLSSWWAESWM